MSGTEMLRTSPCLQRAYCLVRQKTKNKKTTTCKQGNARKYFNCYDVERFWKVKELESLLNAALVLGKDFHSQGLMMVPFVEAKYKGRSRFCGKFIMF